MLPNSKLPANHVDVVLAFPIKVLLESVALTPDTSFPMKILFDPVVFPRVGLPPARKPMAVLLLPVVFDTRVLIPKPTFLNPSVLE